MGTVRSIKGMERTAGVKIVIGVGAAAITTILFALFISAAVSGGKLTDSGVGVFSKLVWIISAAVGGLVGVSRDDRLKLVKGAIVMTGYLLVLITIAVVTNQIKLQGLLPGILCSALGCLAACGVKARGKKISKHRRR